MGDRIGLRSLLYIGFNPIERSPAVWLADATSLCQCVLFGESPRSRPAARPAPMRAPTAPRPAAAKPAPAQVALPSELSAKIARVSELEFYVDRSAVDPMLSRYSELVRGMRAIPIQQGGRVVGLELRKVRSDGLLGRLGLRDGDRVENINGFQLGSPEQVLRAYARLRTASSIKLGIRRNGRPTTIDYWIR
jgi:general secretion pathway protein C